MILEIYAWAPTREQFLEGMLANRFMVLGEDGTPVPGPEVEVDEIGEVMKRGAPDANGEPTITIVPGHHVNLRAYGTFAKQLIHALPQTDAKGDRLGAFARTHLLQLVPDLAPTALSAKGVPVSVPAGYVGKHGVRLYDPALVKSPYRVRA